MTNPGKTTLIIWAKFVKYPGFGTWLEYCGRSCKTETRRQKAENRRKETDRFKTFKRSLICYAIISTISINCKVKINGFNCPTIRGNNA
ncbi:MAG: hypothetical protein F6K40_16590 [Okeania sp. SIO3I5]|uniref:hypothetical protein n=1 Tax=Okeania sp. SIO3I5 TaxID=2607805 RepID=UPI0013BE3078|nr:hypothetical protein [Okeania sp. SIO3I5]NEQ37787.1 hypothetical protein [Okeania sp. SIO3I5]